MKLQIDNYKHFLVTRDNDVTNLETILLRILKSEILIENIERTNKKNSTTGIKSSSIKKIVELILMNYISASNSHREDEEISITLSSLHNIYIVEYNKMKFCLKFQTANWAVLYKDFFQFTNDKYYDIFDHIFYLVPDKNLCSILSAGTVNYENTLKFMEKYSNRFIRNFSIFGLNINK